MKEIKGGEYFISCNSLFRVCILKAEKQKLRSELKTGTQIRYWNEIETEASDHNVNFHNVN